MSYEDACNLLTAHPKRMIATTWVFGQAIDFIINHRLFNEFYRRIKNESGDWYDFEAIAAALKTNKFIKEADEKFLREY